MGSQLRTITRITSRMKLLLVLSALIINIAKIEAQKGPEDCPQNIEVVGNDEYQGVYKLYRDKIYGNYTLLEIVDEKPKYQSFSETGRWEIFWDPDFSIFSLPNPSWVIRDFFTEETLAYTTDDDDCPSENYYDLYTKDNWKFFVPSINQWLAAGNNLKIEELD